jgi:phage gpG-like protein
MATRTTGLVEAMDELEAITARIRDLSPVLTVAARDTKTLIDNSFRRSRSPDGSPWSQLKPSTIKRRRQGPRTRARKATNLVDTDVMTILVDTDILRKSMYSTSDKSSLTMGTITPYAVYHQFGNGRMLRPFMPIEGSVTSYQLMTGGPAGRHWRDVRDMVIEYIRTGQITG